MNDFSWKEYNKVANHTMGINSQEQVKHLALLGILQVHKVTSIRSRDSTGTQGNFYPF